MRCSGKTRLYVVSDGCLVVILSLRDLLEVLALKIEMGGDGDQPRQMRAAERQG